MLTALGPLSPPNTELLQCFATVLFPKLPVKTVSAYRKRSGKPGQRKYIITLVVATDLTHKITAPPAFSRQVRLEQPGDPAR